MQTEHRQASFSPRAEHPLTIKANQSACSSTAGQRLETPTDFTHSDFIDSVTDACVFVLQSDLMTLTGLMHQRTAKTSIYYYFLAEN